MKPWRALLLVIVCTLATSPAWAAKLDILKGTTCSNTTPRPCLIEVFIQDSSSTVGAGLTGLTNASAGLVCYYGRSDQGAVGGTQLSLVAGTLGTWSSGGFIQKDSANMPGVYELGLATATVASGSNFAVVMCKGATNMAPLLLEVSLTDYDPHDGVRLGLTALPNVASGSAGAIPTTGAGANQISVSSGQVIIQAGAGAGQLDFTSGVVKGNLTQVLGGAVPAVTVTGVPKVDVQDVNGSAINNLIAGRVDANAQVVGDKSGYSLTQAFPTNFSALAITAGGAITVGTNNDKTGYSLTQAFPTNFSALSITAGGSVAIQANVKKNTALATFMFLMTDSTNHNPVTGKAPACTRSIDGGAFAVGALVNIIEVANGFYKLDFGAGDLNGNNIVLRCTAAGSDDTFVTLVTYP